MSTTSGLHWVSIALGGMLGTCARWWLVEWFKQPDARFPVGILVVNALGCLLIGILAGVMLRFQAFHEAIKGFLLIGFLGAFTTFSTFSYDTLALWMRGEWVYSLLNVGLNLLLGLTLAYFGFSVFKP